MLLFYPYIFGRFGDGFQHFSFRVQLKYWTHNQSDPEILYKSFCSPTGLYLIKTDIITELRLDDKQVVEKFYNILVVDDDIAVITSLNLLFKQAGFRSRTAHNPEEASKIIREDTFDLILLDLNFSRSTTGEEGLVFLKQLRSLLPEVPVILITAWASIPPATNSRCCWESILS